jgi:hypothetical protein
MSRERRALAAGRRPADATAVAPRPNSIERYILYLAVFLSPFLSLRVDYFFFTLSDALYCVSLFILLVQGRLPRTPLGQATVFWVAAFVLIATGIYLSSSFIGDAERGVILMMQYFFCFMLLPYILARGDEDEAYRLILIFVLGVLTLDIHGIITFYTVGYTPESRVVTGGVRLATLIENANGAASLNAMAIVIVLWLRTIKRISLITFLSLLSTMVVALVLTSSNSGLIATTTGVVIYFALTFRPALVLRIIPAIALIVAFFLLGGADYLPPTFRRRVLGALLSGDITEAGTFTDRSALNYEALQMIGSQGFSLLGIGADQFRVVSIQ